MATYTTNYQLHQWEASDDFLRTDFNEDFAKIDAVTRSAVETAQAKPEVIAGSYSGNSGENREIALGFRPKAVILFCREYDSVMAYEGRPRLSHTGDKTMLTTTDNGFQVYYGYYRSGLNTYDYRPVTNKSGEEYRYLVSGGEVSKAKNHPRAIGPGVELPMQFSAGGEITRPHDRRRRQHLQWNCW